MIQELILKYTKIRNNYRRKAVQYIDSNDELFNRFRLRADDFDSVIMDLKKIKNLDGAILNEGTVCSCDNPKVDHYKNGRAYCVVCCKLF